MVNVRYNEGSQVCADPWNKTGCCLTVCITCFPCGNWVWYSEPIRWHWQGDSMENIREYQSALLTGLGCWQLTTETMDNVEDFVCKIYDPSTDITQIDQMRVILFHKGKDPDSLPPTHDALKLHINRAHYQTTIWINATVPTTERIDPETCGWERDPYSNHLKPKLLLLEPIPKVWTELLHYCFKMFVFCFVLFWLWFNVPVNNFSVMLRRSHLFLGITSTFGE